MSCEENESTPPKLKLRPSFSTYGMSDSMNVESWLHHGGKQPSDETIKNGFPILYNQIYHGEWQGKICWGGDRYFTDIQKQRWEVMESISGLEPIMNAYQEVCNRSRNFLKENSKRKFENI